MNYRLCCWLLAAVGAELFDWQSFAVEQLCRTQQCAEQFFSPADRHISRRTKLVKPKVVDPPFTAPSKKSESARSIGSALLCQSRAVNSRHRIGFVNNNNIDLFRRGADTDLDHEHFDCNSSNNKHAIWLELNVIAARPYLLGIIMHRQSY